MMRKLFSKIRFLPITIFAATLMLTVRVGDIWQGIDTLLDGSIKVSQATAQETANPEVTPELQNPLRFRKWVRLQMTLLLVRSEQRFKMIQPV